MRSHDPDEMQVTPLESFPPLEQWDDWTEYDAKSWPKKVEKHYTLVPTTCFNCESACGLVAYIDHETKDIRKLEGNPHHPGSRGKNCAKGPATLNQIHDPQRIRAGWRERLVELLPAPAAEEWRALSAR